MKYNQGEDVIITFDTQPNITGLTDMRIWGIDVINDTDEAAVGGILHDVNAINGGQPVGAGLPASELTSSPGTYKYTIVGLAVGTYQFWMNSTINGATSNKVQVSVISPITGDKFYGQAQA